MEEGEEIVMLESLSERDQKRYAALQELLASQSEGGEVYRETQKRIAKRLNISVRSVQRLLQRWRVDGVGGIIRRERSDKGHRVLSSEWQRYILDTWKEGNKGSRQMTPAQVYVRVRAHAESKGNEECPSHMSVYRLLRPEIESKKKQESIGSIGWRGNRLHLKTKSGIEIEVDHSNQVWQVDHTKADVLLLDQSGEVLGRPWLTTVVDSYSRCIMGLHLGMECPSAAVVCLALRNAILPKKYPSEYGLSHEWLNYGLPAYLYTDSGKDFQSHHIEQVSNELGIVLCYRRRPSDGGIVERPFGSMNSEFFSSLPGYTGSHVKERGQGVEKDASLTLMDLERLLVRYIVDNYNRRVDARMGDQSRIERWENGCTVQKALLGERELDICLMRRDSRSVYRGGYLQFNNLTYLGEHLSGYAGEKVVIRYNPRDITTILVYQSENGKDRFIARAHAQDLETEILSVAEAKAMSRRLRRSGRLVTNQSVLEEVRQRDRDVSAIQERVKQSERRERANEPLPIAQSDSPPQPVKDEEDVEEEEFDYDSVPEVEVYYYKDDPLGWGNRRY